MSKIICAIVTEVVVALGEHKAVFSDQRLTLRIDDEGGGPFLVMSCKNDEPDSFCKESAVKLEPWELEQVAALGADMVRKALVQMGEASE